MQVNDLMNDAFLIRDRNSSLRPPKVRARKCRRAIAICSVTYRSNGILRMPRTQHCLLECFCLSPG